jgi:hypothetical protein
MHARRISSVETSDDARQIGGLVFEMRHGVGSVRQQRNGRTA